MLIPLRKIIELGKNLRVNREIRAANVRLIGKDGDQLGLMTVSQAQALAEKENLDLVEISPNATPPVCKIIDYGKFRYQQAKKEKEQRKAQVHIKVKEVKVKPNTDENDLQVKLKRARDFISKQNKVRITCVFRGREMQHTEYGRRIVSRMVEELVDIAHPEAFPKMFGRTLSVVLAPGQRKATKSTNNA